MRKVGQRNDRISNRKLQEQRRIRIAKEKLSKIDPNTLQKKPLTGAEAFLHDVGVGASREVTELWDDPYVRTKIDPVTGEQVQALSNQQQVRESSLFGTAFEQAGYATGATNFFMNPEADVAKEAAWRIQNRPGLLVGEAAVWGLTLPIRGASVGAKVLSKTLQKAGTKGAKVSKAIDTVSNPKKLGKWVTKPTTKHLGRRR